MDVTNTGATGTSGADGGTPSASGGNGSAGQNVSATVNNATDTENSATADGGRGGNGGIGASSSPPGSGPGGNGGDGAPGGNATASATTTTTSSGTTDAFAVANGGTGGVGAQGGQLGGLGGSGADGGTAENTSAVDVNTMGGAVAEATDNGGTGGDSSQDSQLASIPTYQGRVFPGGNGGAVGNTTASAIGLTFAEARVTQNGGGGGSGTEGGTGAASSLTNAVTGSTTDGTLQLEQDANGGAGGEGGAGPGGQGGAATSDLTFDDTASATQSAMVEVANTATAGAAGSGAIGSVAGVDASSDTTITGSNDVSIMASASGGAGGAAGAAITADAGGDGGLGGNASGSASGTTTSATGEVSVYLTVVGGAGGAAEDGAYIDAVPADGGNGGQASIGLVSGTGGASADVEATLAGGNGGTSDGALGGNGAAATLVNAVTGSTQGGTLTLDETAEGGLGGDSFGGTGGQGGDAVAGLAFDDTVNATQSATFFVDVEAVGGEGGFDQTGANPGLNQMGTSRQSSGDGGSGSASGTVTAAAALPSGTPTTVYLTVMAAGGSGLDGGNATASATATGGTVYVQSYATANGGLEQMDSTLDDAGTATADATGTDAGGFVTAEAASNLNNQFGDELSAVSGTATSVVDGTSTAHSVAGFNQQGSFDTTAQAVADVIGLPSAPMDGTDVAAGQTLLFDAEQGSSSASGATSSQTTTTTINVAIDLTPFNEGSEFLLDLHQAMVVGSGVTGVTFDVTDIATPIHEVFTSAASAAAFFTDDVIDLGSFNTVTGDSTTLYAQMTLSVTTDDANSGFYVEIEGAAACFCSGTHILTERGELPVEALAVGDRVVLAGGGITPIVWIGTGRVLATRGRRNAATPVIVRKGALADNVPNRDLRITKAHGLYIDGVLIPVEFLVNHRTILWDDRAQEVEIYHIELGSHDVLIANGAPAESYRDDGNRWLFQNANSGWHLPPQELCAPVLTGGPVVDAAWRRLADRAGPRPCLPTTDDPDLHLLVDGRRVHVSWVCGGLHHFRLPARPRTVRIVSRAGVPQELGTARDPRRLGVALRQIIVSQGEHVRRIEAASPLLTEGFHAFEPDNAIRWTEGDASVPAELFAGANEPGTLTLHLNGTTRYLDEGTAVKAA